MLLTSKRESGRYDGVITDAWAMFRGEDLVPVKRIDFQDGTQSQAKLRLNVPEGWSIESAHPRYRGGRLKIAGGVLDEATGAIDFLPDEPDEVIEPEAGTGPRPDPTRYGS